MMRRMRLSVKLPLLIVVTAVIVVCAMVLVSFLITRDSLLNIELEEQTISVNMYASAVSFYLDEAHSILETTAEQKEIADFVPVEPVDPEIHGVPADKAMPQRNTAISILKNSNAFDYVELLKPDGTIYLLEPYNLQVSAMSGSRASADWYKKLMSSGNTVISNLHISNATRQPVVTIATPVRNINGQLVGIWAGGLSLDTLSKIGLTGSQTGTPKRYGYVTDSRGLIIAHQANPSYVLEQTDFSSVPSVQAAIAGQQGTMQYICPIDRHEELTAYMPLTNIGWAVVYVVPTEVAFAPLYRLTLNTAILGILAVIVMSFGGWAIARQVTKPIERLREAVVTIGTGDLRQRIKVTTGDEVGQLATEFNRMAASLSDKEAQLREYATQLEQKVEERTRELRESEEKYRDLVEDLPDVVFAVDQNGALTYLSPAIESMTGYSVSELMGRTFAEFLHPEDLAHAFDAFQRTLSGQAMVDELRFFTKSGEMHWLRNSNKPIFVEDRVVGVHGVFSDITERKRAEEEIGKLNAELEQRVIDRTSQLETANKELEAFSYSVSHDLRAPLRSIDGFSQALVEDYPDKFDEQGKDYLQRVRSNTQRMGELIDDLLKLSRITRSEMKLEMVNLSTLAQSIATELQKTQPERQVEFVITPGLSAKGDEHLLRLLLENLLDNAWKFTGKHSQASIEFGPTQIDGTQVFFVRDDGAGFDVTYADKLFAPFQRLHSASEFPGSGIGLATAQRIINRHGGRVWAEGEIEKGATFYFTLAQN